MKLPITFEQFKSDPLKALFFAALVAMTALYVDSRNQMAKSDRSMREATANV
jgi:hypothetical protein